MTKELKRRDRKGFSEKRASGSKKEKTESPDKKSGADRPNKRDSKPSFERFKDDSRPSDFGSQQRRKTSNFGEFRKKRVFDKPLFKREREEVDEKPLFMEKREGEPKLFGKRAVGRQPEKVKTPLRNPNDLDDSDLEYGKTKNTSADRGFKKRPYEKKPYLKKNYAKKYDEKRSVDDGTIRLNKYIANAGICSRREADDLISSGVVQVNGKNITEMGFKVKPTDIIKYGGQTLKKERMVYLILNKPKDYITTAADPQNRKTVLELIKGACNERIYPVGRLDRNTTGLLMFTNDGELTKKLTHPSYGIRKIYHAELDKPLKSADLTKIKDGIELEDGLIKVDEITYVGNGADKTQVGVEIHSGKNRIVRRIFEHLGYNVRKLDRVVFGSLTKKDLPRGSWRLITEAEVGMLKMVSTK